ncbi:hypothetical protein PRIPAC_88212 [Pristionchus pacificus]|uniref:Uncharacterized protein n=1 Tax=Pristionchus pacificus TaxID=54126 RepID=A0A454XXV1_PRIPA|nr:hypothetical protein PRIPAC_88212 [Pristionchus pacificus]|eukprot:PDM61228.1 hypothetical protein PRIPAC_50670 [Pristionchus pacificus]
MSAVFFTLLLLSSAVAIIVDTPANPSQLWPVYAYYNWGQAVHAFCPDNPSCINAIQHNGIGYDPTNGKVAIGKAVSESRITAVRIACPIGSTKLRNLGFTKSGKHYVHNLLGFGLKQGWVSTQFGACGATVPIKRWKSRVSDDLMYARDLEWNTWYRGLVQDGGAVQFWMWP